MTDGSEPGVGLMMQCDTPREGGRRVGSRAWTQAAPGAKTQLLLLMAGSDRACQRGNLNNSTLTGQCNLCQCPRLQNEGIWGWLPGILCVYICIYLYVCVRGGMHEHS